MAPMQSLAGCSAELGETNVSRFVTLNKSCSSHLDESTEPSGATRDPGGGRGGRRSAPTAWSVDGSDGAVPLPGRERGNSKISSVRETAASGQPASFLGFQAAAQW